MARWIGRGPGESRVAPWYSYFVPARITNSPAEEAVLSLDSLAVPAKALAPNVLEVGGHQIPVETRRSISRTEAEGLSRQLAGGFIVADRISTEARRVLAGAGWPGSTAGATCSCAVRPFSLTPTCPR